MGFPSIPKRAPKSVQSRTFCTKSVQKARFCPLLGALSGFGGHPTLLRRLIIWRFRLCGSYWNSPFWAVLCATKTPFKLTKAKEGSCHCASLSRRHPSGNTPPQTWTEEQDLMAGGNLVGGLDIFENPTGPPDPRSPKTPQQQKKKFQKTRKPRLSPKVDARSPKVDARSPKVSARSPKVNAKYF